MAFILTDSNKVFPWEKARMLVEFTLRGSFSAVTAMLSRVPGIFLYSFIIRSLQNSKGCNKSITLSITKSIKLRMALITNTISMQMSDSIFCMRALVCLLLILTVWNLRASYDAILIWLDLI